MLYELSHQGVLGAQVCKLYSTPQKQIPRKRQVPVSFHVPACPE